MTEQEFLKQFYLEAFRKDTSFCSSKDFTLEDALATFIARDSIRIELLKEKQLIWADAVARGKEFGKKVTEENLKEELEAYNKLSQMTIKDIISLIRWEE